MSDANESERGRRRSKKTEHEAFLLGKTPTILSKPPGVDRSSSTRASSTETVRPPSNVKSSDSVMPTRILRSEDDAASSSSVLQGSLLRSVSPTSEESAAVNMPKIQIQQKSAGSSSSAPSTPQTEKANVFENSLDVRLAPDPEMKGSVKLIDESLQWCDQVSEFLQDNSDFLVVGVLGLQGTGKSTVMSLLAGTHANKSSKFEIFKSQSRDQREMGEHCTKGVDLFITNHRIMLLDVQPMLSPSVMDHAIQFEKKFPSEYNSTENAVEIQSLQLASFLLAVCHAVIFVQDWFTDMDMLRFVQAAELLRPSALLPGHDSFAEDAMEYLPHLVVLHNKCNRGDFEPSKVKVVQQLYLKIFGKSKLKFRAPVGIALGTVIPYLCPEVTGEPVNLFFLPLNNFLNAAQSDVAGDDLRSERPNFQQLVDAFKKQIYSLPRQQISHAVQTEKNWFHYASRSWETVKKSGLFMDYCRLLS